MKPQQPDEINPQNDIVPPTFITESVMPANVVKKYGDEFLSKLKELAKSNKPLPLAKLQLPYIKGNRENMLKFIAGHVNQAGKA